MSGIAIEKGSERILYVGPVPGRKREAICIVDGEGSYDPIAYVRDTYAADKLKAILRVLAVLSPANQLPRTPTDSEPNGEATP